jgi:hypothetical protein
VLFGFLVTQNAEETEILICLQLKFSGTDRLPHSHGTRHLVEFEGLVVCTLCHWIPNGTKRPAAVLNPFDPMMPSPQNNTRCRSTSCIILPALPQAYRIPAYDILKMAALDDSTLQLVMATSIWEMQCMFDSIRIERMKRA